MSDVSGTERFHGLDALRGIAALVVVAWHISNTLPNAYHVIASGYLAVDFFFLLSGFVIATAYEPRLRTGLSLADFGKARVVRLYPMIVFGVAIGAITPVAQLILGSAHAPAIGDLVVWIAANGVLLPAPYQNALFPLNPPQWSLFYEMLVNILFSTILFRMSSSRLLTLALLMFSFRFIVISIDPENVPTTILYSGFALFVRAALPFTIGIILWRLGCGLKRSVSNWTAPLVGFLFFFVLMIPIPAPYRDALNLVTVTFAFPLVIFAAASHEVPRALHAICAWLGNLSYPIYTIHWPIMLIYASAAARLKGHPILYSAIFCALSIAAAQLALVFYDLPARRWLGRKLKLRGAACSGLVGPSQADVSTVAGDARAP